MILGNQENQAVVQKMSSSPHFSHLIVGEAVKMAVDARRVTEAPGNVLSEYVEEADRAATQ